MKRTVIIKDANTANVQRAVELCSQYANFCISGLTAKDLYSLQSDNAPLFSRVCELMRGGRWTPFSGIYSQNADFLSHEAFSRSILYSHDALYALVGRDLPVIYAGKIYGSFFAECVYHGKCHAAFVESENESFWLESPDGSRILVIGATALTDLSSLSDEEIASGEFLSLEETVSERMTQPMDLPVRREAYKAPAETETERKLLLLEAAKTAKGKDCREQCRTLWLTLFDGEEEAVKRALADETEEGEAFADIRLCCDGAELIARKFSEDGTGDTVIRLRETAGKSKAVYLMCDTLGAGFRFELDKYETLTFRIDRDGYAEETFLFE